MIKLAANLSFLYQDVPFLDRFEYAARDGFKGVEYLFPYDHTPQLISDKLAANNLQQILFNAPPGNWAAGDRGLSAKPGAQEAFREAVHTALHYAKTVGCQRLHVMSGLRDHSLSFEDQRALYINNLTDAAKLAAKQDVTLLIEPINTIDMPGYFLNDFNLAADIITQINSPHLKLQFDIYHCQRICGDVIAHLKQFLPLIGHIQIANPPHRNEPSMGELNYPYIFEFLENNDDGWIGCEYKPSQIGPESLLWAQPYLQKNQA